MPQTEGTGLFQFLKWGTESLNGATGLVTGGGLSINPQPRTRLGIGGLAQRRGGLIVPGGSAEMYLSATNSDLIAAAFRASYPRGALTELLIEGGADAWSVSYETAVIQTLGIEYSQDEGLRTNIEWGALFPEETTGSTQAAEANTNFEDYEFVITFEEEEYGVTDFSVSLNNNVTWRTDADTKDSGKLRLPTHYIYGVESCEISLTTNRPIPESVLLALADCQPNDLEAFLTGTNCAGDVVELELTNLIAGENTHGFVDPNTAMQWAYNFEGSPAGSVGFTFTRGGYS